MKRSQIEEIIREELKAVMEVAPPGREKQVKGIKKHKATGDISKTYTDPETGKRKETNPWALAWAQHKKYGKPTKENIKEFIQTVIRETLSQELLEKKQ